MLETLTGSLAIRIASSLAFGPVYLRLTSPGFRSSSKLVAFATFSGVTVTPSFPILTGISVSFGNDSIEEGLGGVFGADARIC